MRCVRNGCAGQAMSSLRTSEKKTYMVSDSQMARVRSSRVTVSDERGLPRVVEVAKRIISWLPRSKAQECSLVRDGDGI